ncbi:MAG: S41 family peptidase [Pseudomonadota bacterium]
MTVLKVLMAIMLSTVSTVASEISVEQRETMNAVTRHLVTRYVDPEVGKSAAEQLRAAFTAGRFDDAADGPQFALKLSEHLQALTGDGHLNIEYSATPITNADDHSAFTREQMERWYGAHRNYGVQRIDRLQSNVAYLDLRVFAPLEMGGDTLVAAMNVLADMDAMIIDLRNNGGGMGDAADLLASYLFDGGRHPLTGVYDRPTDTLTQRFTQPYVPGRRFGNTKPVYVLISGHTFSAAEALAYNLQALERAIIVGEVSGGGAHPFEYVPLTEHYVLWSVTARSVNPITNDNWQGVGVKPDIEVDADSALSAALRHLRARAP